MTLHDITKPLLQLLNDAMAAETLLSGNDTQFARRAYVRSLFAYVEGTVWILKRACRYGKTPKGKPLPASVGEFALLSDLTYELKNSGEVTEQPKYLRLPENLKFTFRMVNRMFGCSIDLQVGSAEWQKFIAAIAIRNRITHPKSLSEFDITDHELQTCQDVCHWFNDRPAEAIDAIAKIGKKAHDQKKKPNQPVETTKTAVRPPRLT